MSEYVLLLCEGAHDAAALASIASVYGNWKDVKGPFPDQLPERLKKHYPVPKAEHRFMHPPVYLSHGVRFLEIRAIGSADKVLGLDALAAIKAQMPDAVGIVVDADEAGVASRQQAFRNRFKPDYPHAAEISAGTTRAGNPRLGLWVAPDNEHRGSMDQTILEAARVAEPKLVAAAGSFIETASDIVPGNWIDHRNKATLGAMGQTVRPGAALASALPGSKCWLSSDSHPTPEIAGLLAFINSLASD